MKKTIFLENTLTAKKTRVILKKYIDKTNTVQRSSKFFGACRELLVGVKQRQKELNSP